jgi:hypothetical protein
MKTHLTGALVAAAAVLLLAGCGSAAPATYSPEPVTAEGGGDAVFLAMVEGSGTSTTGAEDEMISLGHSSCDLADKIGDPALAVTVALEQAGGDRVSEDIVAGVFWAAANTYCPEHAAGVGRALGER